jgi:heme exporter protein B
MILALVRRDLKLARRRQVEALLPLAFFVVAAGLFPIGVSPEPQTCARSAPAWSGSARCWRPCCR